MTPEQLARLTPDERQKWNDTEEHGCWRRLVGQRWCEGWCCTDIRALLTALASARQLLEAQEEWTHQALKERDEARKQVTQANKERDEAVAIQKWDEGHWADWYKQVGLECGIPHHQFQEHAYCISNALAEARQQAAQERGLREAGTSLIVAYYEHHDTHHADCKVPIVSRDIDAAVERAEHFRQQAAQERERAERAETALLNDLPSPEAIAMAGQQEAEHAENCASYQNAACSPYARPCDCKEAEHAD